jgi:hypothetical protein
MLDTRQLWRKTFIDKYGHFVIVQSPNLPLAGWIAFELIALIFRKHHISTAFQTMATTFLFTWAYLEITRGVNYFRKILGLLIAILIVIHLLTT